MHNECGVEDINQQKKEKKSKKNLKRDGYDHNKKSVARLDESLGRRRKAKMLIGAFRGDASAGGACKHAELEQEGFVNLLDCIDLFLGCRRKGGEAAGASVEFFDDGAQELAIDLIQAVRVYIEHRESFVCDRLRDMPFCAHLGVVAGAA